MRRLLVLSAFTAALAACHAKQEAADKSAAAEILPGSASDSMIAYDTLKSQPPLAEPAGHDRVRDVDGLGGAGGGADAGDEAPTGELLPSPGQADPQPQSSE